MMIEAPVKEPRDLDGPDGVRVEVVSRTFAGRRGPVQALDGMSLHAAAGEIVAVVGPSGCGKTTLLELICGLQSPDSGAVRGGAGGADAPARPAAAVAERARQRRPRPARPGSRLARQARAAAAPWLERFGLGGFERARPAELSGGMRQRVSFLRSLLAGKPVLALDEPFASLDAITRAEMQGWLAARARVRAPRTVVLVTHDVEEAVMLADRVVVMSARPGPGGGRDRRSTLSAPAARTDPDVVALRERALDRAGGAGVKRVRSVWPACWCCSRCSAAGSSTSTRAVPIPTSCRAARDRQHDLDRPRAAVAATSCPTAGGDPARDSAGARVVGLALAVAMHLVAVAAAGRVPAARRLADDPDPAAGAPARALARLRPAARAGRDRARLVLLDRRHDPERARGGRPRTGEADALVRCVAAADLPPRRAPGGAAGRVHRGEDRGRGRRDRRCARRARRTDPRPDSAICSRPHTPSS